MDGPSNEVIHTAEAYADSCVSTGGDYIVRMQNAFFDDWYTAEIWAVSVVITEQTVPSEVGSTQTFTNSYTKYSFSIHVL